MIYKQEKREKRNTKTKPQLYGLIRKMRWVYLLELIDKRENVHVYITKLYGIYLLEPYMGVGPG